MAVCISLATLNKSQQGQLLFEGRYNTAKQLHSQLHYIWLNNTPVGFVVKNNNSEVWNIYAIHTDHLNTPRLLTNQNGSEAWRWASDAFGESAAEGSIEFNLRFPGQYYDGESGLHYNYFRDYNAQTGRYVQSDPIGLQGGLNTYGYVNGNPLNYVDPLGLAWFRPDGHKYVVGRDGTIVPDGKGEIGGYIEDYVPAMHTMGIIHDELVASLTAVHIPFTDFYIPDLLVNVPTMLPVYIAALSMELNNSIFSLFGSSAFDIEASQTEKHKNVEKGRRCE